MEVYRNFSLTYDRKWDKADHSQVKLNEEKELATEQSWQASTSETENVGLTTMLKPG